MDKEQSDKLFDNILKELPKNWIDIDKDKFSKVGNDIGYYQFVVNEEKAYFIFGGSEVLSKLLKVFVNSPYPKEIKKLFVGTFNESLGDYNYKEAVKILSKGYFPNLEIFSIGFYDELCNSGMYFYGELGDITLLLKNMPNLKELELCGYFILIKPLEFKKLQKLTLWSESDIIEKDISQNTLDNFLLSSMPLLKRLEIFVDDESSFVFPKKFLDGKTTPKLDILDIEGGFLKTEEDKLLKSNIKDSCNFIKIVSND